MLQHEFTLIALSLHFSLAYLLLLLLYPNHRYYSGFAPGDIAYVTRENMSPIKLIVNGRTRVPLTVAIGPRNQTWFVVRRA